MAAPTYLSDPAKSVVIDASVAINLSASGYAFDIIKALARRVLITNIVLDELEEGRRRGRRDAERIRELLVAGLIEEVRIGILGEGIFHELVAGCAVETLDDGESATIAYAVEHGAVALIDENKATSLCSRKFPQLQLGCTIDVFSHPNVLGALGHDVLSVAVLNSLRIARMNVMPQHIVWVLTLIGLEQASSCTSLPRSARFGASNSSPGVD